jgi:hypothetical protein
MRGAVMESKEELRNEKLKLLLAAINELSNTTFAVRAAQGHYGAKTDKEFNEIVLKGESKNKTPIFSEYFKFLQGDVKLPDSEEFSNTYFETLIDKLRQEFPFQDKHLKEIIDVLLEKHTIIKDDIGEVITFLTVLSLGLLKFPEIEDDPRFDYVAMKTLFCAGKVIERWKHVGKKTSDIPSNIGSKKKKNRYSDQEIIEAFHKCEGKNLNAMAVDIEAFLADHKKKSKSKRDVPSVSTIKRALKDNGLDKELKK